MVEGVDLHFDGVEHLDGVAQAPESAEEADELCLEVVLVVEAVFDDEREELVELFHGGAELEKDGGWVFVHMRRDVNSGRKERRRGGECCRRHCARE